MMQPDAIPADRRVGPHPYMGDASDSETAICPLDGCGLPGRSSIHWSAPGGSRLVEAAKAVARLADTGAIIQGPSRGVTQGLQALVLLQRALELGGHLQRVIRPSEAAMTAAVRLREEDPELFDALDLHGPVQFRTPDVCEGCGAHSGVPCEPNCRVELARRAAASQ